MARIISKFNSDIFNILMKRNPPENEIDNFGVAANIKDTIATDRDEIIFWRSCYHVHIW